MVGNVCGAGVAGNSVECGVSGELMASSEILSFDIELRRNSGLMILLPNLGLRRISGSMMA